VLIEGCTAVIADLMDVIPHIACAKAHLALVGCVLVWALYLAHELSELFQADPLGLVAATCAHRARGIAGILATLTVLGFSVGQIGFTVAVLAMDKDLNFDHHWLLSGV
jgi:hypothetical protein